MAYKLFLLTVNVLFTNGVTCRHINQYENVGFFYHLPIIYYDYLSNTYVEAVNRNGHCIIYWESQNEIEDLLSYPTFPFTCYAYENVIFSPVAFANSIPYYLYYTPSKPTKSKIPMSNMLSNQNVRISEKQCALMYNGSANLHLKRNMINVEVEANESIGLLRETPIKKVQISKTQIAGGTKAYHNEFPYMCALGWRKNLPKYELSYNCGCVLIDRQYALTAAHCATVGGQSPLIVRLGDADLDTDLAEIIKIESIILHPDYESKTTYNDIAMVKLRSISSKTPACLWPNMELPQETLIAIGYGQTTFSGPVSNTLLKISLNVVSNKDCNLYYAKDEKLKHGITLGQICAGDPQGKMDTCQGDSGGPLIVKNFIYKTQVSYVVGLTSFGKACASSVPGVYTRISYYIDWIEAEVWK